jgi:predicted TIM-barrel fold metal-dependent hydrolase
MWRANKTWRGVRPEVPWIDRPPAEILRERVRATLQPVDAPAGDAQALASTLDHMAGTQPDGGPSGGDRMLLFSTDYPHWHFDGVDVLPDGLPADSIRRIAIDNALETYPRLREGAQMGHNASDATGNQETVR